MRGAVFSHFLIALASLTGSVHAYTLGGFYDNLLENSEESLNVGRRLPAPKNRPSLSQDAGQLPEEPSLADPNRQAHRQLRRVDYTENIFERVSSGRVVNELLDAIANCIDDSGIFDFLNPSEEEIDSNDNATQGATMATTASAVTQPTTHKAPESTTSAMQSSTKKKTESTNEATQATTRKPSTTVAASMQPTTKKATGTTTAITQMVTKQ